MNLNKELKIKWWSVQHKSESFPFELDPSQRNNTGRQSWESELDRHKRVREHFHTKSGML